MGSTVNVLKGRAILQKHLDRLKKVGHKIQQGQMHSPVPGMI